MSEATTEAEVINQMVIETLESQLKYLGSPRFDEFLEGPDREDYLKQTANIKRALDVAKSWKP